MVIAAGIDAGTETYEVFAIDGGDECFKYEVETSKVKENPELIFDAILKTNAEIIAGLSGYGSPVKRFSELTDRDIFLLTLNREKEAAVGLRSLIELAIRKNLNIYTIPGVIHLTTVPNWRKINRIDMGTSDKLCSIALALNQLSEEESYEKQDFVLVEAGYGFNAFIAVKGGKVVDGIGGTSGFPSYLSIGSIDAELAYLLSDFPKSMIFSGGIKSYLESKGKKIEKMDEMPEEAVEWVIEFIMKGIRSVEVSIRNRGRIITSGRFFSIPEFKKIFEEVTEGYEIIELKGSKQSAEGAAIIADGLAGGEFKELVEHLEIKKARGTALDYITPDVREYILTNSI
jgi:predicted butyrate kinase (DUF1464 family)